MARQIPEQIILVGGTNLNRDTRVIRKDQTALTQNAFPVVPGILHKRPGITGMRLAINGNTNRFFPLDLGIAPEQCGAQLMAHLHKWDSTTPIHLLTASSFNVEDSSLTNGITQSLGTWQPAYEPVQFVLYRGQCLAIVPGLEGFWQLTKPRVEAMPYTWVKCTFDWPPLVTTGQTQSAPVTPRVAFPYKQRMMYLNFGAGMGHWAIVADLTSTNADILEEDRTPVHTVVGTDVLAVNGRHLEFSAIEGEAIVAGAEITLSSLGSQIDSMAMILTEKSCLFMSGNILQTTESGGTTPATQLGTAQANRVNFDCGCVSANTLVKTPYGHIWAGPDDVWMLKGNVPERIGTNIRPALLACPTAERKYWSAAYANGKYILSLIITPARTEAGDAVGDMNTYVHQQWWLDMQDGPPADALTARWYGPMVSPFLGVSGIEGPILSFRDSDGTQRAISLVAGTSFNNGTFLVDYTNGASGQDILASGVSSGLPWTPNTAYVFGDVVRPDTNITTQGSTGRIYVCTGSGTSAGTEPTWPTSNGGTVVDGGVTWAEIIGSANPALQQRQGGEFKIDVRSPDTALQDYVHEKLLRRVDVNLAAMAKANVSLTVLSNQGQHLATLGPVTVGGNPLSLGVMSLSDVINSGEAEARAFRPDEDELVAGRQFQIKFQDSNGYIIDDSNDHLIVSWVNTDFSVLTPVYPIQVALTHGEYANIDAILTEIVAKLNAQYLIMPTNSGGATIASNAWSFDSAYDDTFPYFTRLSLAYGGSAGNASGIGFFHDSVDTDVVASVIFGVDTGTFYGKRCRTLLAMLGFDTAQNAFQTFVGTANLPATTLGAVATLTATPVNIDGIQIVQQYNSVELAIITANKVIQPKSVPPLKGSNRS